MGILIISGVLRCLQISPYFFSIQFYITSLLVVLTVGVVHNKPYQRYFIYSIIPTVYIIKTVQYIRGEQPSFITERVANEAVYSTLILFVFLLMTHFLVKIIEREIKTATILDKLANTDFLTGAGNRRSIKNLDNSVSRFCALMIDLDHFKNVNDTYGHAFGDMVLKDGSWWNK